MYGDTKSDRIRNAYTIIKGFLEVTNVIGKMKGK